MMMSKYGISINDEVIASDINRLTNQLWKLIPMRENEENWILQLDSVIIEVVGLSEIFGDKNSFLILLSKLEGLKISDTEFKVYRKTVFEAISLLREMRL